MVLFSKDEGVFVGQDLVCEWKRVHVLGMGHEGPKAQGRKQLDSMYLGFKYMGPWSSLTSASWWTCPEERLGWGVSRRLRQAVGPDLLVTAVWSRPYGREVKSERMVCSVCSPQKDTCIRLGAHLANPG